jgi:DNA helicase IV
VDRRPYHGLWDEVFTESGFIGHAAALDDQSAFIASLGTERSDRMRDVLGTIQADQDAIIRAGARGALVVEGGPGTGKTVVALHRAAYLLYSDPRLGHHRGDILVVGPHEPYLAYVSDVLPSLGEEGVQTCTLRELVPGGADATVETDSEVARLKASADLVKAIEPAARRYEQPPKRGLSIETPWAEVYLNAVDWEDAFAASEPGTPHNEAREQVWQELAEIVLAKLPADADVPQHILRRALSRNRDLLAAFDKAWPLIEPSDVVAAFWGSPGIPALVRTAPGRR